MDKIRILYPQVELATYGDLLEGAAEHGDQHIDENNGHNAEICSVHQFAHKLRELVLLT